MPLNNNPEQLTKAELFGEAVKTYQHLTQQSPDAIANVMADIRKQTAELTALREENKRLREALEPFGDLADSVPDSVPDFGTVILTITDEGGAIDTWRRITVDDLRRARTELAKEK